MKWPTPVLWILLVLHPVISRAWTPVVEFGRGWPEVVVWNDEGDGFFVKTGENAVWEYDLATLTGTFSNTIVEAHGLSWGVSDEIERIEWPSPNNRSVAVTYAGSSVIEIYDIDANTMLATLLGHQQKLALRSVAWSRDSTHLVTWDTDGLIQVWDAGTFERIGVIDSHVAQGAKMEFSPDSRRVAVADTRGKIYVFDTFSGELEAALTGLDYTLSELKWQPNGMLLAAANGGFSAISRKFDYEYVGMIWDVATGQQVAQIRPVAPLRTIAWHPSGAYLAIGSETEITIWDANARQFNRTTLPVQGNLYGPMLFSPDGSLLLAHVYTCSHSGGDLYVWAAQTFQLIRHYDCLENLPPVRPYIDAYQARVDSSRLRPGAGFRAEIVPWQWVFRLYRE